MWNIWQSEWKMTVRQRSYYAFLVLWVSVISLLFLLQNSVPSLSGYTNITATVINIALYIIPLFMLILGSFSIANEIENGAWALLNTFPLSTLSYVAGKIGGQLTAQIGIFTFSYGFSLAISLLSGNGFSTKWLVSIYLFSIMLIFIFLLLGITVGCIVTTRWQALTVSVMIWFFLIMIWPTALISILGLVPYTWISPLMEFATYLNPAEFLRVTFIISLDGGAVFGQSYDTLVTYLDSTSGNFVKILYFIVFVTITLLVSMSMLEWRKRR